MVEHKNHKNLAGVKYYCQNINIHSHTGSFTSHNCW